MFSLQKRVFDETSEKLVAVLQVKKLKNRDKKEKKGKKTYLCLTALNDNAFLHQVRVADNDAYQRRHSWNFNQLVAVERLLDDDGRPSSRFILEFDKLYEWIAQSGPEAQTFIASIQKLAQRYCKHAIHYMHVNPDDPSKSPSRAQTPNPDTSIGDSELGDEEGTVLTSAEEAQAQAILSSYNWSSGMINTLTAQLEGELDAHEAANIHALLASEQSVAQVMTLLDATMSSLSQVETAIDEYAGIIKPLNKDAARVAEQEAMLRVQSTNNNKLKTELLNLMPTIEFPEDTLRQISRCDLATNSSRDASYTNVAALTEHLNRSIKEGWQHMTVVQSSVRQYLQAEDTFATRLVQQLEALIERQETLGQRLSESSTTEQAAYHKERHAELASYTGLMQWLQQHQQDSDVSQFDVLAKSYSSRMSQVYAVHVEALCEGAKIMMASKRQSKHDDDTRKRRADFAQTFKRLLGSLMQLVQQEEEFCQALFGLTASRKASAAFSELTDDRGDHDELQGSGAQQSDHAQRDDDAVVHGADTSTPNKDATTNDAQAARTINSNGPVPMTDQPKAANGNGQATGQNAGSVAPTPVVQHRLRDVLGLVKGQPGNVLSPLGTRLSKDNMLATLFAGLDSSVTSLIEHCCQSDPFHATSMTLQLDEQVANVDQDAGFLKRLLGHCLVMAKRHYNTFVAAQETAMREIKYKRSQVAGILPIIPELELLVKDTEAVVLNGSHRLVVDKAYQQWMGAIFEAIYSVSEEAKHPNVLLFENLRRLYDLTSTLKIDAIKEWRRKAQVKYREHLQAYVESILGRPMAQLSAFFEGVEAELAQGTSIKEVAYKFDYNKKKLQAVLKLYPGKEVQDTNGVTTVVVALMMVKKGLEGTFKRMCRHLSDEDLVDVVWRSVQEEFIKQYQRFQQLIDQCYGEGQKLEFTADDVLQYFSEIAQEYN